MAKKAYIGVGGKARKVKKGYVGVHQVPQAEYAVLEYIQSTGTQYIDTGICPNQSTNAELDCAYTGAASTTWYPLFGVHDANNQYYFSFVNTNRNGLSFGFGTQEFYPVGTHSSERRTISIQDGSLLINGSSLKTADSATFSTVNNMYLFALNRKGTVDSRITSMRCYSFKVEKEGDVVRNYVPAKRISDNAVGLYDKVEKKFYANAGTGVLIAGAETGEYIYDIPQEGNFARRIQKAYVGVGGVARPCWGGNGFSLYGEITGLYDAGTKGVSANTPEHAIFFGGTVNMNETAYDSNLTRLAPPTLISRTSWAAACASVGQYALLSGGGTPIVNSVSGYDANLTLVTPDPLAAATRYHCGASAKHHAIFGGGWNGSDVSSVSAYDSDLVRTVTSLSVARSCMETAGTYVGGFGLIPGGKSVNNNYSGYANTDAFDSNMTRNTVMLSVARGDIASASNGKHALLAGGGLHYASTNGITNKVDVLDDALTLSAAASLQESKRYFCGVSLDGFFLFAGGATSGNVITGAADQYDESLTHVIVTSMPVSMYSPSASVIGDYAIFAGGQDASENYLTNACAYMMA